VTSRLALESSYNTLIAVQRETLDNLAEGIAVFGGDGRLGLWNPPFARLWGLDADELDARPHIGDLVRRIEPFFTQSAAIRDILVGNALDRTPRLGRIVRADGLTLEYRGVPLPDGAVLNSFIDVTDSVRFEQALRDRNDALIAADQLKLDFLANVSYQLRTPLNAMIGFSEILTNRYFGELNTRQEEYVQGVLQAGRRLEALIDAILDLSSIEAGYLRLELEPIDIAGMIEEVRAITGDWAQRERIDLTTHCDPEIGGILADGRRIKQALLNLVSNAIKFTRPGGRIQLSAEPHPSGVALIVADDGIGIPEEDRERVFAPFERARRAHPRSGAGVGLALVKRFINMHGGSVELISDPNRGTRVVCILPRRADVQPPEDSA
jgi:signal transduction histidine kinase